MMLFTQMFFVFLTLSTIDATRSSNLRGKEQGRKLQSDCQGHPVEITFQYNGGDCSQSDHHQVRQWCTDSGRGPPTVSGAQSYITVTYTSRERSDIFFSGLVKVGEKYTLNEPSTLDKLPDDIHIKIFESQEGTLLQNMQVSLHCSQQWFLSDKFGSSQVTQWVDTFGRTDGDWVRDDTNAPTDNATNAPTNTPTVAPTDLPTNAPTNAAEKALINAPTDTPTTSPSDSPLDSSSDSLSDSTSDSTSDSHSPSDFPSVSPSFFNEYFTLDQLSYVYDQVGKEGSDAKNEIKKVLGISEVITCNNSPIVLVYTDTDSYVTEVKIVYP